MAVTVGVQVPFSAVATAAVIVKNNLSVSVAII